MHINFSCATCWLRFVGQVCFRLAEIPDDEAMIVAFSRTTSEAVISGSVDEYQALAIALQRGTGQITLDTSSRVTPYDQALTTLHIQTVTTPIVEISVNQEITDLFISGSAQHLATLAGIISDSAHPSDPGRHVHLEAFPGHEFLAEDSVPLVIMNAC